MKTKTQDLNIDAQALNEIISHFNFQPEAIKILELIFLTGATQKQAAIKFQKKPSYVSSIVKQVREKKIEIDDPDTIIIPKGKTMFKAIVTTSQAKILKSIVSEFKEYE